MKLENIIKTITLFSAIFALSACAFKDKDISLDGIQESITSEIKLSNPTVNEFADNKAIAERYGISIAGIDEGFAYTNDISNEKADEIIVIKAKEKKDVNEIEKALEAEIASLAAVWEKSDKKEYEKVQKHILKSKGKYVILAIAEENKKAEEIFNRHLE